MANSLLLAAVAVVLAIGMIIRTYRATFWTKAWYDREGRPAESLESHFKTTMSGNIRSNREKLAERGVRIFQNILLKRYRRIVPKGEIKVRFEREEPAHVSSTEIRVESREMKYRGKRVQARELPVEVYHWRRRQR